MASLSLKQCGQQDWLKDEEKENREVTIINFFGVILFTKDCHNDELDSRNNVYC